jgi:hypothetical protein
MDVLRYTRSAMENLKMKSKYKKDNYEALSPEDPVEGGVFLDEIFKRFGIDLSSTEAQLNLRWSDIVGSDLSKVIFYEKIADESLFVTCKTASYASFVRLSSNDIIKKINSAFPELNIKKLMVRVSPYRKF